jgi:hypothetical protein
MTESWQLTPRSCSRSKPLSWSLVKGQPRQASLGDLPAQGDLVDLLDLAPELLGHEAVVDHVDQDGLVRSRGARRELA